MSNLITWIATFVFCAGCVFSYKIESNGNTVTTVVEFPNEDGAEKFSNQYSAASDLNSITKDLLSTEQDSIKSTTSPKPYKNELDNRWIKPEKFYASKPTENFHRRNNNYKAFFQVTNLQKSPRKMNKDTTRSIPMDLHSFYNNQLQLAESRHANSSGALNSTTFQAQANIGGYCRFQQECPPFSACKSSKCTCEEGYAQEGSKCVVPIYYRCFNDCQRTMKNSYCYISGTKYECRCPTEHVATPTECLIKVKLGRFCKNSVQCPSRSDCHNGTCVCMDGYVNKTDECVKANFGACFGAWDCPLNKECSRGLCVCKSGYVKVNNSCLTRNEDKCYNDNECQKFNSNTICLTKLTGNICQCLPGYVEYLYYECLKKAILGGACKRGIQCPLRSMCVDDICVCENQYVNNGFECVPNENKDECFENYDCQQYLKYSVCDRKLNRSECRCLPDYVATMGECFRKATLGSLCMESIQCPRWSDCIGGTCSCMNGFVRRGSYCYENSHTILPNSLLALIAGVVFLIVVLCLFFITTALRRRISRLRSNTSSDEPPTVSSVVDARLPVIPDPSYERVDKPPTYDEAMSSSTTLLMLNAEDITSEPPSYNQIQQQNRSGHSDTNGL